MSFPDAIAALATLTAGDKRGQVLQLAEHHGHQRLLQFESEGAERDGAMRWLGCKAKRRIVVAGEMLELGPLGEQMHREAGTTCGGEED